MESHSSTPPLVRLQALLNWLMTLAVCCSGLYCNNGVPEPDQRDPTVRVPFAYCGMKNTAAEKELQNQDSAHAATVLRNQAPTALMSSFQPSPFRVARPSWKLDPQSTKDLRKTSGLQSPATPLRCEATANEWQPSWVILAPRLTCRV